VSGPFAEGGPIRSRGRVNGVDKRRTGYPAAQPCTKSEHGTCLHRFAAGYCLASDLCGPCTTRLMVACDWVAGEDLPWCHGYVNRAEDGGDDGA